MSEKVVLFGPVDPPIRFWTFGPILDQLDPTFWPYLAFFIHNSDFLCKIHTQGLKLSGKVVLFVSLG